jgi:hypothetical protein
MISGVLPATFGKKSAAAVSHCGPLPARFHLLWLRHSRAVPGPQKYMSFALYLTSVLFGYAAFLNGFYVTIP